LEIPRRLRAVVRARESSLIALAALVGAIAGLVVAAMSIGVDVLHQLLFRLDPGVRLSGLLRLDPVVALTVPLAGGAVFGIATELIARWRPEREIDPIEANALHGGRMSLLGSIIVAAQTVWSSGVGASVGLEAGYTQLGGGIASRLGMAFRLRRADLRILVGCGAAGGIAGAFGAPLAGAFYGFELIIGGYSRTKARSHGAVGFGYALRAADLASSAEDGRRFITAAIGSAAAASVPPGAGSCEMLRAAARAASLCTDAVGGRPADDHASGRRPWRAFSTAVAMDQRDLRAGSRRADVPLGSGIREACLSPRFCQATLAIAHDGARGPISTPARLSVCVLSVSVVGGPLTMKFIALETTGDLWLTTAVLIAVIISAQMTREVFGYSFATWRFHLRGETIRSAADIGWMRELTVGKMMRRDIRTAAAAGTIAAFRDAFPVGSTTYVIAVDDDKRYAGMVRVADAHAAEVSPGETVRDLLHYANDMLLPGMAIKDAVLAFDRAEAESLPVVDSYLDRRVVGLLTEAHARRRYSAELERRRQELVGKG
jgi:CIC family chloride channel protein